MKLLANKAKINTKMKDLYSQTQIPQVRKPVLKELHL